MLLKLIEVNVDNIYSLLMKFEVNNTFFGFMICYHVRFISILIKAVIRVDQLLLSEVIL